MNYRIYGEYVSCLLLCVAAVFFMYFIQEIEPVFSLRGQIKDNLGWNWLWPVFQLGAMWFIVKMLDVDFRGSLGSARAFLWGTFFWFVVKFLSDGVPQISALSGQMALVLYQLVVSFAEEGLFRGCIFVALRDREKRFYPSDWRQSFSPVSIVLSSAVFGLLHGLRPIVEDRGGFDFSWFGMTFSGGMLFCFFFLVSKTIALPGWAHFTGNMSHILYPK